MIVFAHPGHWLVQLLYAAPVVVMLVFLVLGKIRHTRASASQERDAQDNYDT